MKPDLNKPHFFQNSIPATNLDGNLPHWRQDGVTYFVTFRTADSLPQEKLDKWRKEKEEWEKLHLEPYDDFTRKEFHEKFTNSIELWLDQNYGSCLLKAEELKMIVENALKFFDKKRYDLGKFVVMPNHVHAVLTPKKGFELSDILHSWKSFTANAINKKTGQSGSFWQKESFDHIVRSSSRLEKINEYINEHNSRSGFQPLSDLFL